MSLQSGSDNILKRMNRQYTIEEYLNSIEKLKLKLDRPAITTDIIVGFPGETDEDFEKSVTVAKKVGFSKIHVFSFSPREGTAAAKMLPKVRSEIIKERSQRLRNLDKELASEFRNEFIGEKVGVIIENEKEKTGKCERYYTVEVRSDKNFTKGQLIYAKIANDVITADLIDN